MGKFISGAGDFGSHNSYHDYNQNKNFNDDNEKNTNLILIIGGIIILLLLLVILLVFLFGNKSCTVVFDSAGGTTVASQTVKKRSTASRPEVPIKDGYAFVAWDYNGEIYDFATTPVNDDIKLTAIWEKVEGEYYVVTFDTAGGGDIPNQIITETNKLVRPDDPVKSGYTFIEWYLNDAVFDFASDVKEDIVLVAKWEKNAVTNDGGSNKNDSGNKGDSGQKPATNGIKYGDVNEDGKVNISDSSMILKYLEWDNYSMSDQAKKNADINGDGKVNYVDCVLINGVAAKHFNHDINKPLGNYVLYGDLNEDGKVNISDSSMLLKYLEWDNYQLTLQALKNADINADGKIDNVDNQLIMCVSAGLGHTISKPLKKYVLYGDVNEDGKVNISDSSMLLKYLEWDNYSMSAQAKKNADINGDGKVNYVDNELILAVSAGHSHSMNGALKNYVLYGDVNEDGKVNATDYTKLLNHLENSVSITAQGKKNADVNADGKVNYVDAQLILGLSSKVYSKSSISPLKNYVLYGDANEDGKITKADSDLVLKYVANHSGVLTTQGLKNADANADGKVNLSDSTAILSFIDNKPSNSLPLRPYK